MPAFEPTELREVVFFLTYKQHGGSGLNWTPADVLELDLADVTWYIDRLTDQRKKEASQLERAAKRRK